LPKRNFLQGWFFDLLL